ncbi:hypothetical protein VQ042_22325 [Aurantimonas sp. A2-1-M11]|uniref:hypothetical protein n=1 Tax=Aurantimonas sp. A2-1-M11 TaxID=3113712 RepID=UPI002F950EE8
MTETLLSPSNILLFGRVVEDLDIVDPPTPISHFEWVDVASVDNLAFTGTVAVDEIKLKSKYRILLKNQSDSNELGVYKFVPANSEDNNTNLPRLDIDESFEYEAGMVIRVRLGKTNKTTSWRIENINPATGNPTAFVHLSAQKDKSHKPSPARSSSANKFLQNQLSSDAACFARVYGFSYEGTYYDLPRPVLFLVHGEGVEATEYRTGKKGMANRARAPGDPSLTGLAAADFDYADELKVWSYDKADYTIRMDVDTGMFEQVLLNMFFGDTNGASGPKVAGAMVSGAMVSGAKVSGAMVSGVRLSGRRGDASD